MAVAYSFLAGLAMLAALPISITLGFIFAMLAYIPLIGTVLAGAGKLITSFGLLFGISFALLLLIDKYMKDFAMRNRSVALIASFLIALAGVLSQFLFG